MLLNQGLHFDCYGESLMYLESVNEKQMKATMNIDELSLHYKLINSKDRYLILNEKYLLI